MTREDIALIITVLGILLPTFISVVGVWGKIKKENIAETEKVKKFKCYFVSVIVASFIIIVFAVLFVKVYPFKEEASPTTAEIDSYDLEDDNSRLNDSTKPNVTEKNILDLTTTMPKTTIPTTEYITEKTVKKRIVYNQRIPIKNGNRTKRLMDVKGANNYVFYLIDNGSLLCSGVGTCIYPLNREFQTLNLTLKVVLPLKKNTTNKATLTISGDDEKLYSIEIDKNFEQIDLAIDVSDINILTLYYEELGYTHISLGFWIEDPILIY